jgi:hypothetical protein
MLFSLIYSYTMLVSDIPPIPPVSFLIEFLNFSWTLYLPNFFDREPSVEINSISSKLFPFQSGTQKKVSTKVWKLRGKKAWLILLGGAKLSL